MKKLKKIASLLLAMMLAVVMTVPAFASSIPDTSDNAEEFSITITNQRDSISIDGQEFKAYKLFNLTYNNDNKAYSYTVAEAFKDFTYETHTGDALIDYVGTLSADSSDLNNFAKAVFAYVKEHNIEASGSDIAENGEATILLEEAGYYLVSGGATNEDGDDTVTAACMLNSTNPTFKMQVKADAPSIDKVIVNADSANGEDGKGTAQDVGSTVEFKLTSKVPNMTGYTKYVYTVHDTMSKGLTFNGVETVKVTVGSNNYEHFNVDVKPVADDGSQSFDIVFNSEEFIKLTPGADIVITYSATINENALKTDVETNTVNLEYSNNPNDEDETGKTPDKPVYVYDIDIVIDKYAGGAEGAEETKLANAKFVLKNASKDKYYKLKTEDGKVVVDWVADIKEATEVVTDENGYAKFEGLDSGTYYLQETEAPNGYNKLEEDVKVVVTIEYKEDGTINTDEGSGTTVTVNDGQQLTQTSKIENKTGSLLPSTGGIGTTIFYVVGGILVVGAGVLLITKRRMRER